METKSGTEITNISIERLLSFLDGAATVEKAVAVSAELRALIELRQKLKILEN